MRHERRVEGLRRPQEGFWGQVAKPYGYERPMRHERRVEGLRRPQEGLFTFWESMIVDSTSGLFRQKRNPPAVKTGGWVYNGGHS